MKDNMHPKNIARRFKGESPDFFKKLLMIGATIGTVSLGILGLPATLATAGVIIVLPAAVKTIATIGLTIGATTAVVSKATVKPSENDAQ